jgi:hypothetical protein
MITATDAVKDMMEFVMRPLDARPTEKELKAMAKEAYRIQLARTRERLRENPEHRDMHRRFNRAHGDFHQFLEDTGGRRPITRADIDRVGAEGWSVERLEHLGLVSHQHFSEQPSISVRTIDSLLKDHGFQPQPGLRNIVERALYPAYKRACAVADTYWDPPATAAAQVEHLVPALAVVPDVPDKWRGKTVRDAKRIFFNQAQSARTFDAKRQHQALDSAWLLDECSGRKPVYEVSNEDLRCQSACKRGSDSLSVQRSSLCGHQAGFERDRTSGV